MHSCLSRIKSSNQTSSPNGTVGKCSSVKVVAASYATLSKTVKNGSMFGVVVQ